MVNYRGYLQDNNSNNLYIEDVYSTNETKTNKVWIDGKPIYRKTIFVSSLPNNEDAKEYSHNITNMNIGWFDPTGCFAIWPTGVVNTFSYMNYTGANLFLHDVTKNSFKIKTTQDRSGLSAYVTILYTKTTD